MKKISGIILMLLGIGAFFFGHSMSQETAQKEMKLSQAEEKAQNDRRPVLGPVRANIHAQANAAAQQKIGKGEQTVARSQVTANWLRGTGVVLFLAGLGCFLFVSRHPK